MPFSECLVNDSTATWMMLVWCARVSCGCPVAGGQRVWDLLQEGWSRVV